jgi:hypothetical protein
MAEKESKNFDDVLLSQKTLEGMSLNINDRVFFKRIMDQHFYLTQEYIAETYRANLDNILEKVQVKLDAQKDEILEKFKKLEDKVSGFDTKVNSIDDKVKKIQKFLSWRNIIIYSAILLGLSGFIAFLIDALSRVH